MAIQEGGFVEEVEAACLVLQSFALGLVFESAGDGYWWRFFGCEGELGLAGVGRSVGWVCSVLRKNAIIIGNGSVERRFVVRYNVKIF